MRSLDRVVLLALGSLLAPGCAETPPPVSPDGAGVAVEGAWPPGPANPWNGGPGVVQAAPGGAPPIQAAATLTPPQVPPRAASAPPASPVAAPADTTMGSEGEEVPFSTGGTGTVDAGQVKKVLHGAMPNFVSCYQRALSKTPSLRGKFAARFRIEPDGTVRNAATTGPGGNPEFQSCVTDAIRGLQFPKPRGGAVEVVYPLTFEPA